MDFYHSALNDEVFGGPDFRRLIARLSQERFIVSSAARILDGRGRCISFVRTSETDGVFETLHLRRISEGGMSFMPAIEIVPTATLSSS